MELRQLELFVAVAEERSFTRAAARSHVVQSSASVSIQSLERELGAQLFDRSTHKVELTDAGLALLEGARLTLAAAEEARERVAAVKGHVRGTLRLGVMQSLTAFDLASELARYRQRHPGVALQVCPALGGSHELAEATRRGELDAAFVMLPAHATAGLTTIVLASEPLSLVGVAEQVPAGTSPLPLDELAGLKFVDFPPGWGVRTVIDQAFIAAGLARQVDVEVADLSTCLLLLHAGLGVALLPGSLDLGAGTHLVRREVTGIPPWEVMMVLPEGQTRRAATSAFVAQILAAIGTTEAGVRLSLRWAACSPPWTGAPLLDPPRAARARLRASRAAGAGGIQQCGPDAFGEPVSGAHACPGPAVRLPAVPVRDEGQYITDVILHVDGPMRQR